MSPPIDRIVFWQPIASPHQQALLEAVAGTFAGDVLLGVERGLPRERALQGWPTPAFSRIRPVDISREEGLRELAAWRTAETLHVFSGFFSHPHVWRGFRALADSRARLAIMSEAPEQPWHCGWVKRLRGRLLSRRWSPRVAFILAIGGTGVRFFSEIGFPADRIVPFGYFLEASPPPGGSPAGSRAGADESVRLAFAGQFIRRKGVDVLVDALGRLPRGDWTAHVIGDGPLLETIRRRVAQAPCAGRVTLPGGLPNAAVRDMLVDMDVVIAPSRFDGWGMVVNEALAAGTPVICTDACGAALLAAHDAASAIVPAGDAAALAAAIAAAIARGRVSAAERRRSADLAREFAADVAAGHLVELVAGDFAAGRARMMAWLN